MSLKQFFAITALFLVCILPVLKASAAPADTIHVITHNAVTVVTDPAAGIKYYPNWAVFPSLKTPVRKINLKISFGCPDNLRCADWDYLDHVVIRRKGSKNSTPIDYEIGRMLTPYGGTFGKDWNFQWQTDVTDFSMLLRDSVEIDYVHTGYEPNNDRGWKITVDFEIITGKSVLEPLAVHKIYDNQFRYGDSTQSIETTMAPVSFTANKNSTYARVFIYQTGHGMDASGCGEFCNRYRELWFNNKMIDKRPIWKKCGDNPLYPQAGTWIIDRAYWCPGELKKPDIFDIPVKAGETNVVDINMEPYVTKNPSASETITAYLIEYKKPAATNDAAIVDIIRPTDQKIHLRQNPAGMRPAVVITNNGSNPIQSLIIEYGTDGFKKQRYQWKGNLSFNEKTTVELPGEIDAREVQNIFRVTLISPNGKKDEVPADNSMSTGFTKVATHGKTMVLHLRTNSQPEQNSYFIKNSAGKVLYERKLGSLEANKDYRDSLEFEPGKYEMLLTDTAGNGLEFWFNRKGGRGFVRLLDEKGKLIKDFESDFGSSVYYGFEVSENQQAWNVPVSKPAVGLFPTQTNGKTTLDYFSNTPQKVVVKIVTDPGDTVVEEHVYDGLKEGIFDYDMSYRPAQRYYVKVYINGELQFNKRLRVAERK